MSLHWQFHYKMIFVWPEKIKSSLSMWWLLIWCARWWLWASIVDQQVQSRNLAPLLKSESIKGFMRGIILFRWPWRCTSHLCAICTASSNSFFYNTQLGSQFFLSFCIQFFKQCVSIVFKCALAFVIERMTTLASDACSKTPINIKFHNLHGDNIRKAMGEIASYHKELSLSFFFGSCGLFLLWLSYFVSCVMVLAIH